MTSPDTSREEAAGVSRRAFGSIPTNKSARLDAAVHGDTAYSALVTSWTACINNAWMKMLLDIGCRVLPIRAFLGADKVDDMQCGIPPATLNLFLYHQLRQTLAYRGPASNSKFLVISLSSQISLQKRRWGPQLLHECVHSELLQASTRTAIKLAISLVMPIWLCPVSDVLLVAFVIVPSFHLFLDCRLQQEPSNGCLS
jgi:hypothetical protein